MKQTVVGVFDRYAAAQHAATLLQDRGIDPDCIHVTSAGDDEDPSGQAKVGDDDRGLLQRVRDFFAGVSDDDDEVGTYSEAVRRGGAVVRVDVDDDPEVELACQTLQGAGAVDIDEQAAEWRGASAAPTARESSTTGDSVQRAERRAEGEEVIPVVREELSVGKRTVQAGGVRVYAHTVEEQVRETVQLREERARIERRPVDRPASTADLDEAKERTIEVTESKERPVVQKTARVVEEVVVGKDVREQEATVQDKVRHTEVDVKEMGSSTRGGRAYEDYDTDFRSDFASRYVAQGGRYEDYEPAYRFGHSLRADQRFAGRSWQEVERDAQRDWSARYPDSKWERSKEAVRHAWERVTD